MLLEPFHFVPKNYGSSRVLRRILNRYRSTDASASAAPAHFFVDLLPEGTSPIFAGACINGESCLGRKCTGRVHAFSFACDCRGSGVQLRQTCLEQGICLHCFVNCMVRTKCRIAACNVCLEDLVESGVADRREASLSTVRGVVNMITTNQAMAQRLMQTSHVWNIIAYLQSSCSMAGPLLRQSNLRFIRDALLDTFETGCSSGGSPPERAIILSVLKREEVEAWMYPMVSRFLGANALQSSKHLVAPSASSAAALLLRPCQYMPVTSSRDELDLICNCMRFLQICANDGYKGASLPGTADDITLDDCILRIKGIDLGGSAPGSAAAAADEDSLVAPPAGSDKKDPEEIDMDWELPDDMAAASVLFPAGAAPPPAEKQQWNACFMGEHQPSFQSYQDALLSVVGN